MGHLGNTKNSLKGNVQNLDVNLTGLGQMLQIESVGLKVVRSGLFFYLYKTLVLIRIFNN